MAAWKLNTHVHVVERDSAGGLTGRSGTFGPGGDVPEWAVVAITNPDVWESRGSRSALPAPPDPKPGTDDSQPTTAPGGIADELAQLRAELAELRASQGKTVTPADSPDATPAADGPPPKGGPGSGAPAWRDYAASKGVQVADDASRDDVIAALTAAGVPTE